MKSARAALALLALAAGAVQAVPPDARLGLQGRKPHFERIEGEFLAVEVDPPEILRAELLPSSELLLEPRAPGLARVFLFAKHLVRVIEVAVDVPLPAADPALAVPPPACLEQGSGARVASTACYEYWRARLRTAIASAAPPVTLEGDGLIAELKAAQLELERAGLKVKLALSPFGVRLIGARDDAERRRGLRAIWPVLLGPLRMDE
jgi:hypothetical protein